MAGSLCITENRSFHEVPGLIETLNIHTVGWMMLQAAFLRTESCEAHNREDYPETSDAWQKNIIFQRRDDGRFDEGGGDLEKAELRQFRFRSPDGRGEVRVRF